LSEIEVDEEERPTSNAERPTLNTQFYLPLKRWTLEIGRWTFLPLAGELLYASAHN
jgi:hypothetical protein